MLFFQEINILTDQYANYKNIIYEVEYKKKHDEEVLEDQKNALQISAQNLKLMSNKIYVHFKSIEPVLELSVEQVAKMTDMYNKITKGGLLPVVDDVECFVIEINKLLVTDVIRNLLETAQDTLDSLYSR